MHCLAIVFDAALGGVQGKGLEPDGMNHYKAKKGERERKEMDQRMKEGGSKLRELID